MPEQTPTPTTGSTPAPEAPAPLLSWSAPSAPTHERSAGWYTALGVIVLVSAAYGIISGSWTFTVVVVLCGGIYFLMRGAKPTFRNISITGQGVLLDGAFTGWDDCEGFWIIRTPEYTELHIGRKNRRLGDIIIQTGTVDIAAIRATLAPFLQEQSDKQENFLDALTRALKL